MTGTWTRLAEILRNQSRAALVTIVEVRGSTPRMPGTRMVVTADASYSGTIGGGALEYQAIQVAQLRLKEGGDGAHLRRLSLGPELGQCCGGYVVVLIEPFGRHRQAEIDQLAHLENVDRLTTRAHLAEGKPVMREPVSDIGAMSPGWILLSDHGQLIEDFTEVAQPLLLFGAGHVGRALVLALAPLPFRVLWIDGRTGQFPEAVPANVTIRRSQAPEQEIANAESGAFVLIMTHSHALDLEISAAALTRPDLGYIGLIGSATKRARFVSRLRDRDLAETHLARLNCPIGLVGICGKSPAVIAASVAADLLERTEAGGPTATTEPQLRGAELGS